MEITGEIDLTETQRSQIELHTFLNMLNILLAEMEHIRKDLDSPDALPESASLTRWILVAVRNGDLGRSHALKLASIGFFFSREIHEELAYKPEYARNPELQESIGNVNTIISVLTLRLQEYFDRQESGVAWIPHSVKRLDDNFRKFFTALEKNSRGRYHILFNVAERGAKDYLVNLSIGGCGDDTVVMPPVVQDVFRDLIANARKYTPPGGEINAGLVCDDRELRLVVEDNGSGIPENEIRKVVGFGYRGSNMRERETKGGGFGLTKAYAVTRQFDGRMWIKSEVNRGTRVTIRIPVPGKGD